MSFQRFLSIASDAKQKLMHNNIIASQSRYTQFINHSMHDYIADDRFEKHDFEHQNQKAIKNLA